MEKKTVLQQLIERQEKWLKTAWEGDRTPIEASIHMLKKYLEAEKAMLEEAYNEGCDDFRVTFETYYSQFLTQPTQNER